MLWDTLSATLSLSKYVSKHAPEWHKGIQKIVNQCYKFRDFRSCYPLIEQCLPKSWLYNMPTLKIMLTNIGII